MKTGEVISAIKVVQLFPNKSLEKRINKTFVDSVNMHNVLSSYKLADIFNLKTPAEHSLRCIEGSFAVVADTKDFLELDYEQVAKILGRSALEIFSEVEIFTAADSWLRHNFVERKKYAKQLLLKVRVKFLSEHALKYVQRENSAFSKVKRCVEMLNKLDKNVLKTESSSYHIRRHYNRGRFNFLTYENFKSKNNVTNVNLIDGRSFKTLKILAPMNKTRYYSKAVVVKDEVYIYGGYYDYCNTVKSLERYSFKTNAWDVVSDIFDHRYSFSACAFIDSIFFMGGNYSTNIITESCLKYDTKRKSWKKVSSMNEARRCSASVVFQSNIVISGGIGANREVISSVETYDAFADKWTQMPNMTIVKYDHKLVSSKNKLFVIDRDATHFELFDNHSNKFVMFRVPSLIFPPHAILYNVLSIESKLVFVHNGTASVCTYDMIENKWCSLSSTMAGHTCVQVPWF